jgi:hypothetical protein
MKLRGPLKEKNGDNNIFRSLFLAYLTLSTILAVPKERLLEKHNLA